MSSDIEYFRKDPDHCMVAWKRALVWYSVGEVDEPQVDEMMGYFDQMAARYPDGFCFALYAKDSCKLPNASGRKAASTMFAAQKDRLSGMAALFEGHGFFMASARAVLSTMLALARQPFETHVSGDLAETCAWLCARTPDLRELPDGAVQLAAILEQIASEHASLAAA